MFICGLGKVKICVCQIRFLCDKEKNQEISANFKMIFL